MKLSIRFKAFLALFVIIIVGLGITTLVLSLYLKKNLIYRIEGELARHAMLARIVIYKTEESLSYVNADEMADAMGKASSARVTIILSDGRVIGDSNLSLKEVMAIENHSNREEVREALHKDFGKAVRYSETLKSDMLYLAVSFTKKQASGVIRIAKPLSDVAEALAGLRRILLGASFVGLIIAGVISLFISQLFSRRLKSLVLYAEQLVGGEKKQRLNLQGTDDEIGGIAGSLSKLATRLEEHVSALAEERDQFESVLDAMSETVIALDAKRHVTLINRAGIILLGVTGEPVGKRLLETARIPELHEIATAETIGEEIREFDLPGEGASRRILARVTKLRTGGVLLVLRDITELRRLERVRRDFVSNVSHELRTPVSIIQANAETLRDGAIDDAEAAGRFLDAMIKSTNRLSNLISDLLDISRIEEGKFAFKLEPLGMNLTLRRAAAALETKAMARDFSIAVEPTNGLEVMADAGALDQVLFNLVDNAVKYAGQGGNVVMRAQDLGDTVRIEVIDNGPGIEPKYRDRLFERFFRVDKGRSRDMGGTGLGLAIVKHLVSAMNGRVGMAPADGGGSIFWVLLKAAPK